MGKVKNKQEEEVIVPLKQIPDEYLNANYGGVFLLFLTGKSKKEVERKKKQAEKLAEVIKLQ